MASPRVGLGIAAVACIALLGASAPSCVDQAPTGADNRPTIQFEGDSITVLAASQLDAHYGSNYRVGIYGVVGATSGSQLYAVDRQAAQPPDIEVINLGTNDAVCGLNPCGIEPAAPFDASVYAANVDRMAAAFPTSTCVVFVTVDNHNKSWAFHNVHEINRHLRTTFAHVADWAAAYDPSYYDQPDTPHPNAAGNEALMGVIDDAIAGCPGHGTTTTSGAQG